MLMPPPGWTGWSSAHVWRRQRRRRRILFGHLQRWQNLISAIIALGAAAWAWQYTQHQITVAQEQLRTAQAQAAVARSELLLRRLGELESIQGRLLHLRREMRYLDLPTPVGLFGLGVIVDSIDESLFIPRDVDRTQRRQQIYESIRELALSVSHLPKTPAVGAAMELSVSLNARAELRRIYDRKQDRPKDQIATLGEVSDEKRLETYHNAREDTARRFEPTDLLLKEEIARLNQRLIEIEAMVR